MSVYIYDITSLHYIMFSMVFMVFHVHLDVASTVQGSCRHRRWQCGLRLMAVHDRLWAVEMGQNETPQKWVQNHHSNCSLIMFN